MQEAELPTSEAVQDNTFAQTLRKPTTEPAVSKAAFGKLAFGLALAAFFLWLSFRSTPFGEVWANMQHLDFAFIALTCLSVFVSHWLRAMRWVIMLQPLKQEKVSTWNSFCAVMVGYAVNIAVPRGGEVARVLSIAKSENIPWIGVLPTMLIDRLLDVALLVLMIGTTLVMLPPEIKAQYSQLMPVGAVMCAAVFVGLFLLPKSAAILRAVIGADVIANKLPGRMKETVLKIAGQFEQGTKSLNNPLGLLSISGLSVGIWVFYWLNMYLMMCAFGLNKTIDLAHSLMVFTVGSIGVLIPTPGAAGTYHFAVKEALNKISGIPDAQAMAFVTVLHALTFVILVCVIAAVCYVVQSGRLKRN